MVETVQKIEWAWQTHFVAKRWVANFATAQMNVFGKALGHNVLLPVTGKAKPDNSETDMNIHDCSTATNIHEQLYMFTPIMNV